nr:RNA-directed DNA polymerase, eukaryota, reverse transcriptase zinc-binding domain protein [Tanacetum cinerariifolium]
MPSLNSIVRAFASLGHDLVASKMSKLDRYLISEGVLDLFPHLSALCLDRHVSDHRPILLRETKKINIQQNLLEVDKLIDQGKSNDEIIIKRITLLNHLQELNNRNAMEISQKAKIRSSIEVQDLKRIVTYKEVKRAVWDCGTNKSPGQMDFPLSFTVSIGQQLMMMCFKLPFILNELQSWCKFKKLNEMIFKVDFEKAFDYVKWDYLDETLKAFGFGSKWHNWISSCLNNAMGSVLVNCSPTLEFQFHKGLKQVFIGEWNNNNIQTLLSVLRCFYLDSGRKINIHKNKLMRIGVSLNVVATAASLIGCSILTALFNYLGMKVGSNMRPPFPFKVDSQLDSALSYVNIQGSNWPVKSFGIYSSEFFYGVTGSDRKLAWIGWNMWIWRFLTDGSSLWTRFIKAIFGNKGALDTHKLIPRKSPWQDVILAIRLLQSKDINLMDFIQKKVGNSENTSFWDDSWLGEVALKVLYKRLYALEICKSISVAEKMGHPSLSHSFRRMPRGCVEQENYDLLCSKVADLVLQNILDRWCWSLEGSQDFLVKSSRVLIDNTILPKAEVPTRWLRVVPIKVNAHAWRVCLDKLPTRANLSLRGMDIPSIVCPLCNSTVESSSHIFSLIPWLTKFGEIF